MRKTFKYRINANKGTLSKADNWLRLCRNLYNCALEERITYYKQTKKSLSEFTQSHELVELKKTFPEYKDVNAQTLKDVIRRIERAYQGFFRRIKNGEKAGFPRYKGKNRYNSFTLTVTNNPNGWKLSGKYLHIAKLGTFKMFYDRPIEGVIKTVTIQKSSTGLWYACFSCDNIPIKYLPITNKEIGIDVGIKALVVDSNGKRIEHPKYLRNAEKLLRLRQRRLSRRKKGSNRRNKARILVAKAHEHVHNQRLDFLHKTANYYIENYDKIYIEDLNIQGMVKNHHLAKSINDSSWNMLFNLLSYKAEYAGRILVKVNARNTTQLCSNCHEKVEKTLAVRTHNCPYCGLIMDRDENAAINILRGEALPSGVNV